VVYPAFTVCGNAFQAFSTDSPVRGGCAAAPPDPPYNPADATPAGLARQRFGLTPVRSPLLRGLFRFLGVHEMFQFPRFPPRSARHPKRVGCPIRRSWDQGLLAAPPRLSQLGHVLHRHTAPRHPPYAHRVFPARSPRGLRAGHTHPTPASTTERTNSLHVVRYTWLPTQRRGLHPGIVMMLMCASIGLVP
jgi:hypothetical protein